MKHCSSCNKNIPDEARFCPYCRAQPQVITDQPEYSDDEFYEAALEELESSQAVKAIWARALAETDGDDAKTNAAYIRMRVQKLASERAEANREEEALLKAEAKQKEEARLIEAGLKEEARQKEQARLIEARLKEEAIRQEEARREEARLEEARVKREARQKEENQLKEKGRYEGVARLREEKLREEDALRDKRKSEQWTVISWALFAAISTFLFLIVLVGNDIL